MQTAKQILLQFLDNNFNGLILKQPLFYNWDLGLRFDLQTTHTGYDGYFEEVRRRASILFQSAFDISDRILLVIKDAKYRRRKLRIGNFVFKQIDNFKKAEISYKVEKRIYSSNECYNVAIVDLIASQLNYENILTAIGNSDFPKRYPRLDNKGASSNKEVYFINIDKNIIFQMYGDRGLDIIAADKETLRPIYNQHLHLLLEYDKDQIDRLFA